MVEEMRMRGGGRIRKEEMRRDKEIRRLKEIRRGEMKPDGVKE